MSPSERAEAALLIRKQVERLTNMTNEVLELPQRLAAAAGTLVATDYGAFVTEAISELRLDLVNKRASPSSAKRLQWASAEAWIAAVAARLLQPGQQRGGVHAEGRSHHAALRDRGDGGKTCVRDTGPASRPRSSAREPFATHGKAKGTGLGLAICRRIIDDHDGSIRAQSEPGQGAVFTFALPRAQT